MNLRAAAERGDALGHSMGHRGQATAEGVPLFFDTRDTRLHGFTKLSRK